MSVLIAYRPKVDPMFRWKKAMRACDCCEGFCEAEPEVGLPRCGECFDGRQIVDWEGKRVSVNEILPVVTWDQYREDISLRSPFVFVLPSGAAFCYRNSGDIKPIVVARSDGSPLADGDWIVAVTVWER